MEKNVYSYTRLFNEPPKIQHIYGRFSLPFEVKISSALSFVLTDILLWLFFKHLITSVNQSFHGVALVLYVGVPVAVVKIIGLIDLQGMSLIEYMKSKAKYDYYFRFKKRCIIHDKRVKIEEKQYAFAEIEILESE